MHREGRWAASLADLYNPNWEYVDVPRTEGKGLWNASGTVNFHPDKRKIKLSKVSGTGHVDFRPVLERLYQEIEMKEDDSDGHPIPAARP